MIIGLGSDHGGFELKEQIKAHLKQKQVETEDFGTYEITSCDYPDVGRQVAESVAQGRMTRGILVCGTGIGMSIVANKVKGIRAALCHDEFSARMSREHNNANILCLGQRVTGCGLALSIVDAWLEGTFEGGRHQARVDKITAIE